MPIIVRPIGWLVGAWQWAHGVIADITGLQKKSVEESTQDKTAVGQAEVGALSKADARTTKASVMKKRKVGE